MVGWDHQLNGHGFGWTLGVGDGQGGLACCSSWGHKELDTTEQLNRTELKIPVMKIETWSFYVFFFFFFHFSSKFYGEGNGTPLQCSCLENPMDGGGWWAAVHGVAKSQTPLRGYFHFSLSCIGEGNGNPLQCSCLENSRDRSLVGCCLWGRTELGMTEVT